jgi:cation diffusion facilitator CzcD-associated flavoprotein CzcO
VTDHIEAFTPTGLRLGSGVTLDADVIVTATGLNLFPLGGVPNRAFALGYRTHGRPGAGVRSRHP